MNNGISVWKLVGIVAYFFGGWETLNWHQQQKNTSSFHDMKIHSLFVSTGVSEN